jgi:arsenate reductase
MIRTEVIVLCTGLDPKGFNPDAVMAMREVGIDISGHTSKNVVGFLGYPIQVVITVCDNAACPCTTAAA